jgi:hypothetical protein
MANKQNLQNAQQTFRQFAWNLAGTLAKPATSTATKPGKR